MKKIINKLRNTAGIAMVGLAALIGAQSVNVATAQTNQTSPSKLSGDLTYFIAGKADSGAPTSYAEINHSMSLPYSTKLSGFIDFYNNDEGYFGKTIIEKGLTERLNLRGHVMHINEPLSQAGLGASYVLPTPNKLFAKVSYLPLWVDSDGNQVENKQIAGFCASVNLPKDFSLWGFGEINTAAEKGPQWSYGELEFAKSFKKTLSVGANIQLNCNGPGKLEPEVVPRLAVRVKF